MVARGVRRNGNPRSEIIQPYRCLQIAWSGKGELMTLTDVEPDKPPYLLEKKKILAGFYLNELLVRLLHLHEAHPELFDIYDKSLFMLAGNKVEQETVMRIFEKHLLCNTGYGLVLDHDVILKTDIDPNIEYFYHHLPFLEMIHHNTAIPNFARLDNDSKLYQQSYLEAHTIYLGLLCFLQNKKSTR